MPSAMATAVDSGMASLTRMLPLEPAAKLNRPSKFQMPELIC
jgi:hypothetical protein